VAEKYKAEAVLIRCRPSGAELICQIKEIHDASTRESEVRVEEIYIDGCGGVTARYYGGGELVLHHSMLSSAGEAEARFKEDPKRFREHYAMDVEVERRKLYSFGVDLPCW